MPSTPYSTRGSKQLTDKERLFVDQYVIDLDVRKAAIRSGYKPNSAATTGNQIMKKPHVKAAIGKILLELHVELDLTQKDILEQLYYVTTRDIREFVDENGKALPLHKLQDRAANCIDGFEQEITTYTDENGTTETIKNKVKLVSKATAIDMAMRYRGLFAPTESKNENVTTVQFDFAKLMNPPDMLDDPVEAAMKALEDKSSAPVIIEASKVEVPIKKTTTKKAK